VEEAPGPPLTRHKDDRSPRIADLRSAEVSRLSAKRKLAPCRKGIRCREKSLHSENDLVDDSSSC